MASFHVRLKEAAEGEESANARKSSSAWANRKRDASASRETGLIPGSFPHAAQAR